MGWVELIILAIKMFGPLIVELLRKLIDRSHNLPPEDRAKAKEEILAALKTGDEAHVKDVIEQWHKHCDGAGCPMDTVGE